MNKETIDKVIQGIGDSGGNGDVIKILGLSQSAFQDGFEIANGIQNLDLIKLLYSNFNQNRVIVEFTLLGKAYYAKLIQ